MSRVDDRGFGLCLFGEKHDARGASMSEVDEEEEDEAPVVTAIEPFAASSDLAAAFAVEIDIDCLFDCGCGCGFRGRVELAGEPDGEAVAGLLPA